MFYIVRRKEDDKYLTYDSMSYVSSWQYNIDENCYLNKEQVDNFKKKNKEDTSNFVIYSIDNLINRSN